MHVRSAFVQCLFEANGGGTQMIALIFLLFSICCYSDRYVVLQQPGFRTIIHNVWVCECCVFTAMPWDFQLKQLSCWHETSI